MTDERIVKTQKNIDELLPGRSEYVLNTSEYEDVRARLAAISQQHKPDAKDNRPTLRRTPSEASERE
jgi:hypothetical protein